MAEWKNKRNLTPIFVRGDEDLRLLFSVDKRTLTRWRSAGMPYCKDGGIYLYDVDEVRVWVHEFFEGNPNTKQDDEQPEETTQTVPEQINAPLVNLGLTRFKHKKTTIQ